VKSPAVLFAYELGAGLGHLNRLLAVAKRLAPAVRPIFAIPDVAWGEPHIRTALGSSTQVVQGVRWAPPTSPDARQVPTQTFADVIRLFGFGETATLRSQALAWRAIIKDLSPDLIVADFAPTLRLASEGLVPTVVVGSGYTIPPAGRVLPSMRPWDPRVPPKSRFHEGMLLAAVNEVRDALGGPSVDHFADLLGGEAAFPCTLAELDPYRDTRTGPVWWPFNIPDVRPAGLSGVAGDADVFCYLSAEHPALGSVLKALSALDGRSQLYVSGIDPKIVARRCSARVAIHTKPAAFDRVLPRVRLFIQHGGLGSSYAGLLAGVPQLVLTQNLEQAINAYGVERLGAGKRVSVPPVPSPETLGGEIRRILDNSAAAAKAMAVAEDVASRRHEDPVAAVVSACARYVPV
jgi:rhamnosyltransferase subunit B